VLTAADDRTGAGHILQLIQDEEKRSEELKRQANAPAIVVAAAVPTGPLVFAPTSDGDAQPAEAAAEQSFNREQVQEQEQVRCWTFSFHVNRVL
jgi:hypothetical protein